MEIFDSFGNSLGNLEPPDAGDGCIGCLVELCFIAVGLILFGPAIVAYHVTKIIEKPRNDGFSFLGLMVAIVVGLVWIIIILGWLTNTSTTTQATITPPAQSAADVSEKSEKVLRATTTVHIRSGHSKKTKVIGHLQKNQAVVPTGKKSNGWVEIKRPKHGWVYGKYLR